ncbi:DNA-binding transcriptional LysR family regulator [Paraburkholderia tropica]|uniref:LysR family transcriptional regulator n=1 Tax=Paraburkholderia TaxID=1822464 RepID=UPI001CAB048F|nr:MULTISPECIES: LysR family transcriptional regulator [Paraburkholderia]CAG9220956.1 DNA-binding transcriptional LysR family regulator [Paraburkholderia tropica]
MDKLGSMKMFVGVAEAGGFAKAATRAALSTAAVSRAIMELEASLQTRLFNRTTRQISLTEAGRRYLEHCERILNEVALADAEAMGAAAQPNGRLRVHATASFGQHYLTPLLARYTQQFEDVSVDLVLAQRTPDLLEERFDVAIVVAQTLKDSSLVSQRLGTSRSVLCAAPQYLARRGTPLEIADLERHTCVQLTRQDLPVLAWEFEGERAQPFRPTQQAPLTVNIAEALGEAIRAGMGIGMLPIPTALQGMRDGSLVQVLPNARLKPFNVFALYASRQYLDAKIRTLVEFLRDAVPRRVAEHEQELQVLDARYDHDVLYET